jgi:AcrR family transcriptional regulator
MDRDRSGSAAKAARTRILDAASDLFYQQGIHAIGIDTVIDRAGVAKASLYRHFRAKDDLTAAVLRQRDELWRAWLTETVEAHATTPSQKLLAVFDALEEWFASEDFRGCGFINAAAEFPAPDHPVRIVVKEHKHAVTRYLSDLAREAGARQPDGLASQLFLLMEGAIATAYVENATWPSEVARLAAAALLHDRRPLPPNGERVAAPR